MSDDKPSKDIARAMMRMTRQINTEALAAIDGLEAADGWRVTCYTCHRGATHPAPSRENEHAPAHDRDG